MADQNLLDQLLKQLKIPTGGWATEATLASLAAKMGSSLKDNEKLAEAIDDSVYNIGDGAKKVKISLGEELKLTTTSVVKTLDELTKVDTTSIASNLTSLSSDLKWTGQLIKTSHPIWSKLIGNLSMASGVLGFLIAKFEEATTMITGLYSNGILAQNGLAGLATSASDVGLPVRKFAELLTKYSNVAVGMGYSRLMKLSKMFADSTNLGSKFIMTNEEAQEALMESMSIMQTTGRLRTMSELQMSGAAEDLIVQINKLSEATGKNRKEILAGVKEASKTPDAFALLNKAPSEVKERLEKIMAQMQGVFGKQGTEMFEEFAKAMLYGPAAMSEDFKKLMTEVGGDFGTYWNELITIAESGGDVKTALDKMTASIHNIDTTQWAASEKMKALQSKIVGLKDTSTTYINNLRRLANMTEEQREQEKKERARAEADAQKMSSAINKTQQLLTTLSNSIYLVVDALTPTLTTALESLATGTLWVINKMKEALKPVRDWIHKFLGGSDDPAESRGPANLAVLAGVLVGGPLLAIMVKKVLGFLIGAGAGMMARGISSLAAAGLSSLGATGLAKLIAPALPKLAGAAATGGLLGGGMLKGLTRMIGLFGSGKVLKGALGLALFSGALYGLAKSLGEFNKVDWTSIGKAGVAIGALTLVVTNLPIAKLLTGGAALSALLGAIGYTMSMVADGLLKFQSIEPATFVKAGVAIGAIAVAAAVAGPLAVPIIAGGAAIGVALAAIGAGIAAASWLMGNTLPTLVEGIGKFANLDGNALKATGDGMFELSKGLLALTGAKLVESLGSFVTNFLKIFSEDPITKLKRFAEIGEPLKVAADALKLFADTLPVAITAFDSLSNVDRAINVINQIKQAFSSGSRINEASLNQGIFLILKKFADNRDMITNATDALQNLSNIGNILDSVTSIRNVIGMLTPQMATSFNQWMNTFFAQNPAARFRELASIAGDIVTTADSISRLQTAFSELLSTMSKPNDIGNAVENINRLRLAMNNFTTAQSAGVVSQERTASPVITLNELNVKTIAYYENSIKKFEELNDKIEKTNILIDQLKSSNTENSYRIVNAIESRSSVVR